MKYYIGIGIFLFNTCLVLAQNKPLKAMIEIGEQVYIIGKKTVLVRSVDNQIISKEVTLEDAFPGIGIHTVEMVITDIANNKLYIFEHKKYSCIRLSDGRVYRGYPKKVDCSLLSIFAKEEFSSEIKDLSLFAESWEAAVDLSNQTEQPIFVDMGVFLIQDKKATITNQSKQLELSGQTFQNDRHHRRQGGRVQADTDSTVNILSLKKDTKTTKGALDRSFIRGITFEEGAVEDVLSLARTNNVPVFIYAYSMDSIETGKRFPSDFRDISVGEKYNRNFINIKLDLSKSNNQEWKEKFKINQVPTYLYLTPELKVIKRIELKGSSVSYMLKCANRVLEDIEKNE